MIYKKSNSDKNLIATQMNKRVGILMFLFGMFLIPNAHTNITEIDIDFQVGKCNVDTAYSDNARQLANL